MAAFGWPSNSIKKTAHRLSLCPRIWHLTVFIKRYLQQRFEVFRNIAFFKSFCCTNVWCRILTMIPSIHLDLPEKSFDSDSTYHQVRNIRSKKSPCIDFEISHVFMCQLSTHIKFSKLGQNKVKSALLAAHPQKVACILLLSCLDNQSPFLPFL